jgi:hypothetical protein
MRLYSPASLKRYKSTQKKASPGEQIINRVFLYLEKKIEWSMSADKTWYKDGERFLVQVIHGEN